MSGNNVVPLRGLRPRRDHEERPERTGFKVRERKLDDCKHRDVEIDEVRRVVYCSGCQQPLDAVQVLLEFAKRDREVDWRVEAIWKGRADEAMKLARAEERRLKLGRPPRHTSEPAWVVVDIATHVWGITNVVRGLPAERLALGACLAADCKTLRYTLLYRAPWTGEA